MTRSEMNWEDALDNEHGSNIARKFAIEDLALKYRTSLKVAEKLLANGVVVDRQARSKSPDEIDDSLERKPQATPEVGEGPRYTKQLKGEDMDVDVEGLDTSQVVPRAKSPKREEIDQASTSSAYEDYSRFQFPRYSPRSTSRFVFPAKIKSTNRGMPFPRHAFQNAPLSYTTWPYCVTYPFVTRNGALSRGPPFLYTITGARKSPRFIPSEVLRNRYRAAARMQIPVASTSEERPRVFSPSEERPSNFTLSEERPRVFSTSEERPRAFMTPEKSPREFPEENSRSFTFEEEKERLFNRSEETPRVFTFKRERLRLLDQLETRPRSYTPPQGYSTGQPSTAKPRRHSDNSITNLTRPSVLVMQRSHSNPLAGTSRDEHCSRYEVHHEHGTCNHDHHATDSDSSATSPLGKDGSTFGSDSNLDEKPHECPICGRCFRKHSALVIHNRVHSGEKPYRCPECSKNFSISGNLRRHFLIHTGERPYVCQDCSRAFNNPSHLTRHRRKLHIPKN